MIILHLNGCSIGVVQVAMRSVGTSSTVTVAWAAAVWCSSHSQTWEMARSVSHSHTPRSSHCCDLYLLVGVFALLSPKKQTFHRDVLPSKDRVVFINPVSLAYIVYSNSKNGNAPLQRVSLKIISLFWILKVFHVHFSLLAINAGEDLFSSMVHLAATSNSVTTVSQKPSLEWSPCCC